jgi:hypothetical protein
VGKAHFRLIIQSNLEKARTASFDRLLHHGT